MIDMVTTSTTHVTDGLGQRSPSPPACCSTTSTTTSPARGPLGGPAVGPDEIDTADGDSGGPMFQFSPAQGAYIITGITIGGSDAYSRYGDIANDLRVAS